MKFESSQSKPFFGKRLTKRLYVGSVSLLALTGFAQMPVFKRYYIADIPGLGWLADFFVTHTVHYILAALLLFLCAWVVMEFFVDRFRITLSWSGWVRVGILFGLILSGFGRALKNLPDVYLDPGFLVFVNLSHLSLVLLFGLFALACKLAGSGWVRQSK